MGQAVQTVRDAIGVNTAKVERRAHRLFDQGHGIISM